MPENNEILPEEEEIEFCTRLEKMITDHPVVKAHHGKWKELITWDNGDQFSEWDESSYVTKPVELVVRKKRVVVNLMKPLAEAIEGKINFAYQVIGSPNSAEIGDVEAARVATKVLAHNDTVNTVDALFEDLKYDLIRTGNACMKWSWDKEYPAYTKDGNGSSLISGELIGQVPSIFNIRPDPTAKSRSTMRYLMEIHEVTDEWVKDTFKLSDEDLLLLEPEEKIDKYRGMNEKKEEKDEGEKTHILKEYWEKKSKKYNKGRYILSIGRKALFKGNNPAMGEIPYFFYGYKRSGNSIWHTGPLHHVQSIQREFNRMISMISEHIEAWKPKMVAPLNSNLKANAFTVDPFEILELDDKGGKLYPVQMPELSPQVNNMRDFYMGAVDKVSNVHEVTYSQLPQYASRAPASLYSMMLEQENLKIDPMIRRFNRTVLEMCSFRLRMMDKYYTQERLVKVIGKGQSSTIEYFKGADLKGNFDVKLIMGVSLHQSKAIQQRLLMELYGQRIIEDKNKILKMLNLGEVEEELRGDVADEQRAIRENQAYINDSYGKPFEEGGVKIYLHDDHEVHLDYHTNLAKTEEAQRWKPAKFKALDDHIMKHHAIFMALTQALAKPEATTTMPPLAKTTIGPEEGGTTVEAEEQERLTSE